MESLKQLEVQVDSIQDYLYEIFQLADELKKGSYKKKELLFRGQQDKTYLIRPAIARPCYSSDSSSILDYERNLIEVAKYKMPEIFCPELYPLDLLALLQHHGIPTRLLDVTSNPLVALYFACAESAVDGEVLVFKNDVSNVTTYPVVNAIADSYRFAFSTFTHLSLFYKNVITQPYFVEQYSQLSHQNNEQGGLWIEECCEKILFVHTQERSLRQKMQQGQFILFPNEIMKSSDATYSFTSSIVPIEKDCNHITKRIIIDGLKKDSIRRQLKILGISPSTLFMDNVDIICKEIVDEYKF